MSVRESWKRGNALATGKQKEALAVQYERTTMSVRLTKVENRTAEEHGKALMRIFEDVPPSLLNTLTFDNGGENTCHIRLRDTFDLGTYFCDPYSAWQKGGVENAIGLVRRHLPKETDLETISDDAILNIQETLNNRPRKKLNYRTPNEALSGALNS